MDHALTHRITFLVAGFGALLAAGAFALGGLQPGVGASIGAVVAVANWIAIRWVAGRVSSGAVRRRGPLMFLLVLKMVALMTLCWFLIAQWGAHPVGFALGVGAFVLGILAGSAWGSAPRVSEGES